MLTVPVVSVGNSLGIRIPRKLLKEIGSPKALSLDVKDGLLIASPIASPRAGWDDPKVWRGAKLTKQDREWLDAELVEDES